MIHYDSEKYDVFWKTVQELDIPVYMHPRLASPSIQKQLWADRPGWGPQVFSTGVSIHTLGLCGNGVFDRFPKVQFVIGHLGEGLPADIWRLDHCSFQACKF
jgi:2,3-dihydroxybenzoate decarboxylase